MWRTGSIRGRSQRTQRRVLSRQEGSKKVTKNETQVEEVLGGTAISALSDWRRGRETLLGGRPRALSRAHGVTGWAACLMGAL